MANKSFVEISTEWDIVAARQLGRDEARGVGFGTVDQTRISTAISELARNLNVYGLTGIIIIERVKNGNRVGICVTASHNSKNVLNNKNLTGEGVTTLQRLEVDVERMERLMDEVEIQEDAAYGPYVKVLKWLE